MAKGRARRRSHRTSRKAAREVDGGTAAAAAASATGGDGARSHVRDALSPPLKEAHARKHALTRYEGSVGHALVVLMRMSDDVVVAGAAHGVVLVLQLRPDCAGGGACLMAQHRLPSASCVTALTRLLPLAGGVAAAPLFVDLAPWEAWVVVGCADGTVWALNVLTYETQSLAQQAHAAAVCHVNSHVVPGRGGSAGTVVVTSINAVPKRRGRDQPCIACHTFPMHAEPSAPSAPAADPTAHDASVPEVRLHQCVSAHRLAPKEVASGVHTCLWLVEARAHGRPRIHVWVPNAKRLHRYEVCGRVWAHRETVVVSGFGRVRCMAQAGPSRDDFIVGMTEGALLLRRGKKWVHLWHLWRAEEGRPSGDVVAVAARRGMCASATASSHYVHLWNIRKAQLMCTLSVGCLVTSLLLIPCGRLIAVSSEAQGKTITWEGFEKWVEWIPQPYTQMLHFVWCCGNGPPYLRQVPKDVIRYIVNMTWNLYGK